MSVKIKKVSLHCTINGQGFFREIFAEVYDGVFAIHPHIAGFTREGWMVLDFDRISATHVVSGHSVAEGVPRDQENRLIDHLRNGLRVRLDDGRIVNPLTLSPEEILAVQAGVEVVDPHPDWVVREWDDEDRDAFIKGIG